MKKTRRCCKKKKIKRRTYRIKGGNDDTFLHRKRIGMGDDTQKPSFFSRFFPGKKKADSLLTTEDLSADLAYANTRVPVTVGQGAYGCVIKPSLKCNAGNEKVSYRGKVSKLMHKFDAITEKEEMDKLSNIKGIDQYIIPAPTLCRPELNAELDTSIKNCRLEQRKKDDLRLLVMQDGGISLEKILVGRLPSKNGKINTEPPLITLTDEELTQFLASILNLFKGLVFFKTNKIIHLDIKLANIVYNKDTLSMKFIDFGMATTRDDFINSSTNPTNVNYPQHGQSQVYWPKESSCTPKPKFASDDKCKNLRDSYGESYENYKDFIEMAANTFDVYCLTIALRGLFSLLKKTFKPSTQLLKDKLVPFLGICEKIFSSYCSDITTRKDDLEYLVSAYESLLKMITPMS